MRSVGATVLQAALLLLARARRFHYAGSMLPRWLRRVVHFALALTLAVGLAAQGARAAGMGGKADNRVHAMVADMSMAAAGSMPMYNKCDACKNGSCKGDGCMSSGGCSAYCSNFAALRVFDAIVELTISDSAAHLPLPFQLGWDPPPDPYPPRSTILS
jgi:hypothetical protein